MVIALAFAGAAAAQTGTAVVTRADAAASIGLFSADRLNDGCCWASSLFKGVSTGFYWTEHLKIEAALSAPGRTEAYTGFSERLTGNTFRYVSERHAFDPLSMSVAQTYQFGHNAWFHPFVTGGVSVDREREAITQFVTTPVSNTQSTSLRTTVTVRPFVGTGFKAYLNERTFFTGAAKVSLGKRIDQTSWTAGIGVDFSRRSRAADRDDARRRAPRSPEPVDVWRDVAAQLPRGASVDVTTAGGKRVTGELIAVEADAIVVTPHGRLPEPPLRVAFDRLESLALSTNATRAARVGAVALGAGTGTGVFMTLLMIAFAVYAD